MPTNQYHEYNEEEFNSLPWANDFMNADPSSNEFNNAMAEADKYYGPEWTDKQLNAWGIQFEKEAEAGKISPEQLPDNSPIQKEVEQLYDNNHHNDEIKNDAVEDFMKQMELAQPSKQEQDEAAYRSQLNDMQLADNINPNIDNYDMLHFTPEEDKPTDYMWAPGSFMRKDIRDSVNLINSYPTSQKRAALELLARINNGDIDSYEDMMKANPWMDNAMFDAISSIASNDNRRGKIPVISKASLKRNKAAKENIEDFIEQHPEESSAILGEGPLKEEAEQAIDGGVDAEVNNKAFEEDPPTPEELEAFRELQEAEMSKDATSNIGMGYNEGKVSDPADLENNQTYHADPIELPDETLVTEADANDNIDVVDYGLEDQNQYPIRIGDSDETIAQENVPEVNENDFVKSDVLPSADNVLELKPDEQEAVTEAIEENVPEEEKETYFGMLGIPHRKLGSSSPSSVNANNEQYKLDRLNHAGAASLGRLGGFSTGSGSVSPGAVSTGISKPHTMTEHTPSRAGGGNIPKSPNAAANAQVGSRAGNSNNGFITSNGGNISSGPVQKRSSLKSPKPTQLPNFTGHTAPIQTSPLGSAEDLHEALVERIKGMLDNLDSETRKKLGFSPTLYNYNGTPLDKLDGATLVQLSEMLEEMQNG